MEKILRNATKWVLMALTLTPLVFYPDTTFPFVLPKGVFVRIIIEAALALFLFYCFFTKKDGTATYKYIWGRIKTLIQNPIVLILGIFFASLVVSTILAEYPLHAFWGEAERVEGLFGMLHYGVAMLLMVLLFEKEDWVRFFKISLVVGVVIMWYAALQYFGVKRFPFALRPEARPISFIGNSAFLATHMMFVAMMACIVLHEEWRRKISEGVSKSGKTWGLISVISIVWAVITIFFTATRGAILGGAAGLLVALVFVACGAGVEWANEKLRKKLRHSAVIVLGLMVLCGAVFFFTRSASVWQSIPGLNRLARTQVLDTNDPSTQVRLLTWDLSWRAFKERPIFGWGPENYIAAYLKYYNPDFAIYGETWLDRAHNKLFDLLVMQGVFGFITYIALLVSMGYVVFKKRIPGTVGIVALLIAYFVQNLVLFDQVVSYTTFFALLAFIVGWDAYTKEDTTRAEEKPVQKIIIRGAQCAVLGITIFLGYVAYNYSYIPLAQAITLHKVPYQKDIKLTIEKNVELAVKNLKKGMYPYNFVQLNIRGQEFDMVYLDQYFYNDLVRKNPKFNPLGETLIAGLEEAAKRDPYDIRGAVRVAQAYDVLARENPEKYYPKIEQLMRDTMKIAPNRQELHYYLELTLAKQERFEEAIEVARQAIALSPDVPRAHFELGLVFTGAGRRAEAEAEFNRLMELDPTLSKLIGSDHNSLLLIYELWRDYKTIARMVVRDAQGAFKERFSLHYQRIALNYFLGERDLENLIIVANRIAKTNDGYVEDMDMIIDLAKNGNWDILDKLP